MRAFPAEMRSPRVEPRMKHCDVFACVRILREQASALSQGAGDASECKIFQVSASAGGHRHNMVNVESRLLTCLCETAVFAAIACSLDHLPAQAGRDIHFSRALRTQPFRAHSQQGEQFRQIHQPLSFKLFRIGQCRPLVLLIE
jgi:hypothetical protein